MLLPFNLKEFTMNRSNRSLRTALATAVAALTAAAALNVHAQEANTWDMPQAAAVLPPAPDEMNTPMAVGAPQWADLGEATVFKDMPSHDDGDLHSGLTREEVIADRDAAIRHGLMATGEAGATDEVLARREAFNELQTIEHEARELARVEAQQLARQAEQQAAADLMSYELLEPDQVVATDDLTVTESDLLPSGYYVITASDTGRTELRPYSVDERDVYIERGTADGYVPSPTYLR